jgi:hypothetical protein
MSVEPKSEDSAGKFGKETHDHEEASTHQDKLKWWQNPTSGANNSEKGWGCLLPLFIIGVIAYWGYGWLDGNAWIERDHDTPVWIKGEWLVGEYRVCQIPLVPEQPLPDSAHLLCGQSEVLMEEDLWSPDFVRGLSDPEFAELMAGRWSSLDQHFHILPVHYWGRIDRSDRKMFSWRCQRNSDSLTCKALD